MHECVSALWRQAREAQLRVQLEQELRVAQHSHAAEVDVLTVRLAAETERQRLLLENKIAHGAPAPEA
jgi:hypothetical protein